MADEDGGVNPQHIRKLQKDLRDLLTVLSKPVTPQSTRSAVHPIRASRHAAPRRVTSEGLFDLHLPDDPKRPEE
jgi:hypothetical protein